MASKLSKTISPNTPVLNVGRLLHFDQNILGREDLNLRALDFGSNRAWRRIEKNVSKQVANLGLGELLALVAEKDREVIYQDFYQLEARKNSLYAITQLRLYLVENYLCNELLRVAYDPSKPLPKLLPLRVTQLLNAYEIKKREDREALTRLNREFRFNAFAPAIQVPQKTPNAPNYTPALSLAAA
jgi:hypothetical protein